MEDVWLTRAKRLQAIASTGLHYTDNDYDRDRYRELADLAHEMLADIGQVPVSHLLDLFPPLGHSYATPLVDVRGAVITSGRILLVRERTDGKWCLPGGFADVGRSPAENIEKEIREEAGLHTTARHLFLIRHKARHAYRADMRDFYKLLFICEHTGQESPTPGTETLDARFFDPADIPDLSLSRTIPDDITAAFSAYREGGSATAFD